MKNKLKLLFLLKKGMNSGGYTQNAPKAGLYNSARMTAAMLQKHLDIHTHLEVVIDANGIDRQIHIYKPDYVVLEAIWVTPQKLYELVALHPKVKWIVRIHSEVPFLSNEGIAVGWIKEYAYIPRVCVTFNSQEANYDFSQVGEGCYDYLPNIYEKESGNICNLLYRKKKVINIGCFGAIRPLKNQLMQAFGAIAFGNKYNREVHFHINAGRVEQGGEPTLKNIRSLFKDTHHTLIEHPWMGREEFIELVRKMDLGMQLSFSESFNIVTADFISQYVPIIVSPTISWMDDNLQVGTENLKQIVDKLKETEDNYLYSILLQSSSLSLYTKSAIRTWKQYLNL